MTRKKVRGILIAFILGGIITLWVIDWFSYGSYSHKVKFISMWKELPIQELKPEPTDDYAWGEDIPKFILKKMPIVTALRFDGIQYSYGKNKIEIEKRMLIQDELDVMVNNNLAWTLSDFSIYSSGEDIAIYGYWNDEFRRIRVGKAKDDVEIQTLTPNAEIPFSAHAVHSERIRRDYWIAISEDGHVSAYQNQCRIGKEVQLESAFYGMHIGSIICDIEGNMYMPYIVNNNGQEDFVCPKISKISKEKMELESQYDEYAIKYDMHTEGFVRFSSSLVFPTFKENGILTALIPNNLEKFVQYDNGEAELSIDDDLGWHYLEIE